MILPLRAAIGARGWAGTRRATALHSQTAEVIAPVDADPARAELSPKGRS